MLPKPLQNAGLLLLALVFSIGLMFSFIEIPKLIDTFLQARIGTPHGDPAYNPERIELFYEANLIRLIGYISLGVILTLIIIGFSTRKSSWAAIGGFALFLPVFATFAHSMFYLAGLGLFNVIMFPFLDISLTLIDLGRVVLLPYWILTWFLGLFNWEAGHFLMYFFMLSGAFIFITGVFVWMKTRYAKQKVARHWIYRYSRHPQYLGWIIWSYGLMLYGPTLNQMKKTWGWHGTLPWLLSSMVIIGICMLEELKMQKQAGADYEDYRNQTPFLFPIPRFLQAIVKFPQKLILRKGRPQSGKEVGLIIGLYTLIFIGLSFIWIEFPSPEPASQYNAIAFSQKKADSLLFEIRKPQLRRYRSTDPIKELIYMGEQAMPCLQDLAKDTNPEIREFTLQAIVDCQYQEATPMLIDAIKDPKIRVVNAAIDGLGELNVYTAKDTLFALLENTPPGMTHDRLLSTLSKLKSHEVIPYLQNMLQSDKWYRYTNALRSMILIDTDMAIPYIYKALEDDRMQVRREAVYMLLDLLPEDAIPHLQKVTNDEYWDVRFYAKQAIRQIEEKNIASYNNMPSSNE